MPAKISLRGSEAALHVEEDVAEVWRKLRSGQAELSRCSGGSVHVNLANVLYVEDGHEPAAVPTYTPDGED